MDFWLTWIELILQAVVAGFENRRAHEGQHDEEAGEQRRRGGRENGQHPNPG